MLEMILGSCLPKIVLNLKWLSFTCRNLPQLIGVCTFVHEFCSMHFGMCLVHVDFHVFVHVAVCISVCAC